MDTAATTTSNEPMSALPLFDQIFEVSPARRTDPLTSELAARREGRDVQRERVRKFLMSVENATDFEISKALNILRTSAGKRRKELNAVDTGLRRLTDTKSSAIVWKLLR